MTGIRAWTNARLATCSGTLPGIGIVDDAALICEGPTIRYAGAMAAVPGELAAALSGAIDIDGAWITPGLIDCHTHLVFGGDRSSEFERRLEGATYAQLQAAGGGIFGTVKATREASDEQLLASSTARLRTLATSGVTTVEIKSGYGLDVATEIRMLEITRHLQHNAQLPDVVSTCLAAHALPAEYATRREDYVRLITDELLPAVAAQGLATAVDAFGEHLAFTPAEVRQIFTTARALGFALKLHADQLSDQNGAAIAAEFAALSADHVEYTTATGVRAMAAAGTVAVLLPAAFYYLRETQLPPIASFRRHGVAMAVATDANPGSAPTLSLPLAMNMACVQFGLTVEEALLGVTRHAARALGLRDRGVLEAGKRADFCIWTVERLAEIIYWTGHRHLSTIVRQGAVASRP